MIRPYYQKDNITLYHGDLLDVLPQLPEASVDCVVTDPPYFLHFMEKDWDKAGKNDIPTNELVFRSWFAGLAAGEACFRIHREKDGKYYACEFSIKMRADDGPLLRALARRTAAGKIQDIPPESRVVNSGPAVKWVVQSREDCWKIARLLDGTPLYGKKQREYDLWRKALTVWTDTPRGNRWHGPRDNTAMEALWAEMKTLRPFDQELADSHYDPLGQPAYLFHYRWAKACLRVVKPGACCLAFGCPRTGHRLTCAIEDGGWEIRDCLMWLHGQGMPKAGDIGKLISRTDGLTPATELVKLWTGWATTLKPAWEPIVMAMKPLDGTIAHNAATWGVAGLNIDACRIGKGRWPANLMLDQVAADMLDEQTGVLTSGMMKAGQHRKASKGKGGYHGGMPDTVTVADTYGDSGGASRFFYCSKASKSERGGGNDHPTVKPLALMNHLLTLLSTPTGGVILDPFAGSGSTALAAKQLGRHCICVERDRHNCDITVARLEMLPRPWVPINENHPIVVVAADRAISPPQI